MLLGLEDDGSISGLTRANIAEWAMTTCRDQASRGGARLRTLPHRVISPFDPMNDDHQQIEGHPPGRGGLIQRI